ncbi:MAG: NTP transferase domain-containing protein [Anaerolineales bacterium]|nr:NTP transferase domain-containing protein [Anaerolineales bacterium]
MDNTYAVIMAGGGGTRLWPLSRKSQPKQALRLLGEKTLFQIAVERICPLIPPERILVVTIEEQAHLLQEQVPDVPEWNYILEPEPRGTASVVGLAAIHLRKVDPDAVMAVLTADHYIENVDGFRNLLSGAAMAAREGFIVTLGITPTHATTGYGYIQRGEKIGSYNSYPLFRVLAFKEKPAQDIAEEYLSSGKYYWNSGMFVWEVSRILDEIRRLMPELWAGLEMIDASIELPEHEEVLNRVWSDIRPETIDYGVMEKAQSVGVLPADDLGWYDIGGWDRLFDVMDVDESGNLMIGDDILLIDTNKTLIFQDSSIEENRLVALLGLEELIIVETEDVLLICPRQRAEEVRSIVKLLMKQEKDQYL